MTPQHPIKRIPAAIGFPGLPFRSVTFTPILNSQKFRHSAATVSDSLDHETPNRAEETLRKKAFSPVVNDEVPSVNALTDYDKEHLVTYRGLLDAEAEGADWDEAALLVLHIDPVREPIRARRIWESHLARAKWLSDHRHLLSAGVAD